ncbi:MAG TPA: acyl-CoA dehydrogenase family protein [Candidatus Dormibacteraeota bacterium]|nr:acyl-CoA dehydrogenase family protein [Candidatus Dormibacteraeota bacterium]
MISFELTEEQRQIRDWVHEFAEREIRPVAAHYDETEEFPWPVVRKAAEIGLYSHEFLGQTFADPTGILPALVAEELCWGCAGIALAIQGTGLPVAAIFNQGTPEQIATWVPACYGTPSEPVVGAFCVSEPDAGSDVSSMKTRAVKRNGDWVLNGRKVFITNGGIAAVHVVVAAVDPELGVRGQASFVVPPGTPGLRQGKKEKKMGIRASHTAEVILEDVRVPSDCLLGGEERLEERLARARSGQRSRSAVALKTFEATRPVVGAQALGIARAAFEFALQYAQERRQFGRPLIENQAIAFKLADMATEIEAARGLIWRALWESRNGGRFEKAEGSMAKLKAGEVAVRVTEEAIQICGGYGYIRDFPVEKWHRDAKIYTIFEGTSEIQRLVISRALSER